MRERNPDRIPVNVIAGSLGVGKTTAINQLLEQRPAGERWAVLVNEYGKIGLDAALIEGRPSAKDVYVREVAGGCICCSAGFMFNVSLVLILQQRPDRLLIEPTGLATVSGILDTLARPGVREAVDLRSVICLVDPARLRDERLPVEFDDQVEAADVLLANRSDLASDIELQAFRHWANGMFPRKRLVREVSRGRVRLDMLDLVSHRALEPIEQDAPAHDRHKAHQHGTSTGPAHDNHGHEHPHAPPPEAVEAGPEAPIIRQTHDSEVASTIGWSVWRERVFDAERVEGWVNGLVGQPGLRRLKAVLRTTEGWTSFNFADGAQATKSSAHRRDSRLELIWMGSARPDPEEVERGLKSCLVRA